MEDTWTARDLPVLDAIVRFFDENPGQFPQVSDIAKALNMDRMDVFRACRALDETYIAMGYVMAGGDPGPHHVKAISPAARRAVGQWPASDEWVSKLVRSLDEAAEAEPDQDRRSKLRTAAQVLGGIGREVLVSVLQAEARRTAGL